MIRGLRERMEQEIRQLYLSNILQVKTDGRRWKGDPWSALTVRTLVSFSG